MNFPQQLGLVLSAYVRCQLLLQVSLRALMKCLMLQRRVCSPLLTSSFHQTSSQAQVPTSPDTSSLFSPLTNTLPFFLSFSFWVKQSRRTTSNYSSRTVLPRASQKAIRPINMLSRLQHTPFVPGPHTLLLICGSVSRPRPLRHPN